jgi:FTR1 family protein
MQGAYGAFISVFLIGLREGLEVTLILSIAAAFLKRNGQSTRAMFAAVGVAVLICVGVGVGLNMLSEELPQAQQEMLETIIGVVAVVFVTTMVIWMNRNAGRMQGELEHEAEEAVSKGGSMALVVMAFLAVIKEGFELSVFLLAAAQNTHGSRWPAVVGGASGVAVAIAVGIGLYYGGLKLNLNRFFRITALFLVLIAAGLALKVVRTAHEAGWLNIGQQVLVDFSSWIPENSVQGALITGMFGIPTDPRLIEVLGWVFYVVVVAVAFLWESRKIANRESHQLVS